MTAAQIIGVVAIVIGLIIVFGFATWRNRTLRLWTSGTKTEAVVAKSEATGSKGGTWYRTDLLITDSEGTEHRARATLADKHGTGDRLTVAYDPANPGKVLEESSLSQLRPDDGPWALGGVWVVGLTAIIPGAVLLLLPVVT